MIIIILCNIVCEENNRSDEDQSLSCDRTGDDDAYTKVDQMKIYMQSKKREIYQPTTNSRKLQNRKKNPFTHETHVIYIV